MINDEKIHGKRAIPGITIKFVLVALTFLASIFLFAAIAHEVVLEKEDVVDHRIQNYLAVHTNPGIISIMRVFTFFGSTTFLLPAYVVLVTVLLFLHRKADAINAGIIGIASTVLLLSFKNIFRRVRPDLPLLRSLHSFSFPSGHALLSFIFFSILASFVWRSKLKHAIKWTIIILFALISLLIGISRIILRMHYATDVIAGFCLGIAWVILCFWLMKKTDEKMIA